MASAATMVSSDPKIWVVDDCLPVEFVAMVNNAFEDGTAQCQVVKKPNGRELLARNIDFDVKHELCQEVFGRISDLCGIPAAMPFSHFMVSEVWASGQDAHLDHVNVDDVNAEKLCFLDLTRQSSCEADPRRVVPTVSIALYFNAVGGIRFPSASCAQTIAAKAGRMVIFQNYDDEARPSHKDSAAHYGVYFEKLPRRVLIMGILANETPQFTADPRQRGAKTEALIYCAGTKRDPLYHDNPSYDTYKTPEQIAERLRADQKEEEFLRRQEQQTRKPLKLDMIVTLDIQRKDGFCSVEGRNLHGTLLCNLSCSQAMTVNELRGQVKQEADPDDLTNLMLCLPDGQLLTQEHDGTMLARWSVESQPVEVESPGEAQPAGENATGGSNSNSCCSMS